MKQTGEGWWGIGDADAWRDATDALALWCFARDQARFNRHLVDPKRVTKYNRRLQYLLGVAICRRVEYLFPDPCCREALEDAEAFAEGTATLRELQAACDAVDAIDSPDLPVAAWAAARAVFWLGPDDYQLTEAVELVIDAAGYQAAIQAGMLTVDDGFDVGRVVWEHPVFTAGKREEEAAICRVIRDVLGNPFQPVTFSSSWKIDTVVSLARQMYDSRDFSAMPILADALQDVDCTNEEILAHCRTPGPHARGCWVVDGILDKD